jgi:hypothetical protein
VAFTFAGGTLFSTAQATMHAPQPVQRSTSITIPYRLFGFLLSDIV